MSRLALELAKLAKEKAKLNTRRGQLGLQAWKRQSDAISDALIRSNIVEYRGAFGSSFERDLWFPLTAALLLNRNQQYAAAHEWYRLLYDPETGTQAVIFQVFTGNITDQHIGAKWLDDPFDPVAIANRRAGVWLRHTVLAMVRNLVDWADDEFARGLPDTSQRAQELYELARRTLQAPQMQSECERVLLDVINVIQDGLGYGHAVASRMVGPLKEVRSADVISKADKDIRRTVNGRGTKQEKQLAVERIVARALKEARRINPDRSLTEENARQHTLAREQEDAIFSQPGFDRSIVPPDDRPFDEPAVAPDPSPDLPPAPSARFFCIPPNPVLRSLQLHIDNQLEKLRLCLDFLGEPQPPRVYGCDTYDAATGTINRPAADAAYSSTIPQPRYRYNYLVDKARQYVDVAQRIGALLLQAVQNGDTEAFAQLKASHAIALADATAVLRRLGQQEAEQGVGIAQLQEDRATAQVEHWQDKIGDPDDLADDLSAGELESLRQTENAIKAQETTEVVYGALMVGAAAAAVGVSVATGGAGLPVTMAVLAAAPGLLGAQSQKASLQSSLAASRASFERRAEDWKNQFDLAGFDQRIAQVQVALAGDRVRIAGQELQIAQLQLAHAREELRFLQTKVTNPALYDWMVRVLSRDYRALMQVAACVAKMAQRALEFERQEPVQFISGDYWNVAQGVLRAPALTDQQRSLGLLGAERLLTDLTRLDAYKLTTERRRLQLTKTFSLARMMPTEMVQFRDTGTITFNTLFDWFDEGFQGHLLRLIKSVRISILAIVPPIDGIHGMLHNTGESSVVVQEDGAFVMKRTARNFGESIALDSAFNESGLFALNHDDPMLLPFEGLGVQTQWTLELLPGNNRFDFDTIADVFLTLEYTAEYSRAYEQLMRDARRGSPVHEDTAMPLRMMFPDQWYHLKNHRPDAAGAFQPFSMDFTTTVGAFSPNSTSVNVIHLTVLLSGDFSQPQDQQVLESGISITKDPGLVLHSPTMPAFGPGLFDGKSLLMSTRGAGANGLASPAAIGAADGWALEFDAAFFLPIVGSKPLIERLADVLLVVTATVQRS